MKKNLKRRDFIKKAGLAGAAATAVIAYSDAEAPEVLMQNRPSSLSNCSA